MATLRGGTQGATLLGTARRGRSALLLGTALQAAAILVLVLPAGAQPAPNARPTGGQVVAGSAIINQSPLATTITQSTPRAAVDWRTFDVGRQQTVQFVQPSVTASTLNRVTGPDPSQIAGHIKANGHVVLVNQSGVTFYKGAQVDVAGLVVSAAGITNKNYMAGRMKFDQPARPNARIVNRGNITIRQAGLAALVAPQVANSGVISAKLGRVVLAGAVTHTLDMYGDGLISIDVNGEVRRVPAGPNGKPATALVTNTGTIIAEGGRVLLTARAADGIVQNLVDAGGRIAAPTAGSRTGVVAIEGVGGSIVIAGQLDATGAAPGERGGQIVANATDAVTLTRRAALNASGRAGGGTVAIGTTLARAAGGKSVTPKLTARRVVVRKGARIAADATSRGDGGRVTVLSSEATDMAGAISAKGGPGGGNGGFAEVSGAAGFALTGGVDVSAPAGNLGKILLDPNNLDVVAGGSIVNVGTVGSPGTLQATGSPAVVTAGTLAALGKTGDVELDASGTLGVHTNISVANGLSLNAGGAITIDPGENVSAGASSALRMTAGGELLIGTGAALSAGTINLNSTAGIQVNGSVVAGGDARLAAGQTARIAGLVQAGDGGTLTAVAQSLTLSGGSLVVHPAVSRKGGSAVPGLVELQADAMSLSGGHVVADGGAVAVAPLTTGSTLSLDATTAAGHLSLTQADLNAVQTQTLVLGSSDPAGVGTTAALLQINAGVTPGAGTLALFSTGDIAERGAGAVSVAALTGTAGGHILLGGTNAVAQLGALTGSTIDVADYRDLTVGAPVIATSGSVGIAVHAGAGTLGTLTNAATIQAASTVALSADQDIDNAGRVSAAFGGARLTAGGTVAVTGTVQAGNGGTLTAVAQALTLSGGGSLIVHPAAQEGGPAVPGLVQLQADAMSLSGGHVVADGGAVAVAPLTTGGTLSLDGATAAGHLSLTQADLNAVQTQTLVLGSSDPTGTGTTAGSLQINAGVAPGAGTLALFSTGNIAEQGAGAVSVVALTGTAGGHILLGGTNAVAQLGALAGGTIDVADYRDLTVGAPVIATSGSVGIAVHAGAGTLGTLTNASTIQAATRLALIAGQDIDNAGTIAAGAGAILKAGRDIDNSGLVSAASAGARTSLIAGRTVAVTGTVQAGNGGTLAVVGQSLTLSGGGSLMVQPAVPDQVGALVPGLVELQADAMSLSGGHVVADGGAVAVTPLTTGGTLSLDAATAAGHLSLTQADLNAIQTQTLVLGSSDPAGTSGIAGLLQINAGLAPGAGTLALFSTGDIAEQGAGAVSVAALTGTAGGHILLGGTNAVAQIANLTGGTIDVADYRDLTVGAPVIATSGSVGIAVHAGAGTLGTLTNASTIRAATAVALSADQDIDNAGLVLAGTDANLRATHDIANAGSVLAGGNATLTAGNDIGNTGLVDAGTDAMLDAGHDLANGGLIETGGAAHLHAALDIDNAGSVIAGASGTLVAGEDIDNSGAVRTGGDTVLGAARDVVDAGSVAAGHNAALTAGRTVAVTGTVQAGNGGTLTAVAQALTLSGAGSLIVHPAAQEGGSAAPGRVELQADAMSLSGGHVVADGGAVAVAPLTAGGTLSLDGATAAGHLSLTQADLNAVQTQTLVLGSLDSATATAGRLEVNAGMTLAGIAGTLSLFSTGDIVEQGAGAVSVTALTGAAGGHMMLGGTNAVAQLRALTGGTIDVADYRDLTVGAPVIATSGSVGIAVHAGAGTLGTLTNAATIQAASTVALSADQDIDNAGRVSAGTDADLHATHDIANTGSVAAGGNGTLAAGSDIGNPGTVRTGGDATLDAGRDIDNRGLVEAGTDAHLHAAHDIANGGSVAAGGNGTIIAGNDLSNSGEVTAATDVDLSAGNDIANGARIDAGRDITLSAAHDIGNAGSILAGRDATLGAGQDITNAGLVQAAANADLRAARALNDGGTISAGLGATLSAGADIVQTGGAILSATGSLAAGGSLTQAAGLIATHPSSGTDLVSLTAGTGTIALGGTIGAGEVVLSAPGDIGGTGIVATGLLTGNAGIVPSATLPNGALGSANLLGPNRIATLGAFTTTGSLTLNDAQSLTVTGPVATGIAAAANPGVGQNRFGAAINVAGGGIIVAGKLTAGVAAPGEPAGLVLPGGDIALSADGAISIPGAIAVAPGANGGGALTTHAGSGIGETGAVNASVLTGSAGGAANFAGSNAIQSVGPFHAGDFALIDGRDLLVAGPVAATAGSVSLTAHAGNGTAGLLSNNSAISATADVSLAADADASNAGAVTAGRAASLRAGGSLALSGSVGAGADVTLEAGTDLVQTAGIVSAGGNATLGAGRDITQAGGTFGAGGAIGLTAGRNGLVAGTMTAGQSVSVLAGGSLAASGSVGAGSDVTLEAGTDLVQTAGIVSAGGNATLGAGRDIAQAGGAIDASGSIGLTAGRNGLVAGTMTAGQSVSVLAGGALALAGSLGAGSDVALEAGTDLAQTGGIVSAGRNAALGAGRGITQTGGAIGAGGAAGLTAGQNGQGTGTITIAGAISGAGVRLSAPQDIIETGAIAAAALSGNAGVAPSTALPSGVLGSATLLGVNRIAALGAFLTTGGLALNDLQGLDIAGPVTTGAIAAANPEVAGRTFGAAIGAPAITVSGQLVAGVPAPGTPAGTPLPGGDIALTASGSIVSSGLLAAGAGSNGGGGLVVDAGAGLLQTGGAIVTGTLRGTVGGNVGLDAGSNRIGTIGDFTVNPPATGAFRLTNTGDLRLTGTLTSNLIVIDDRDGQIFLDDGAAIVTGGHARPDGPFRAPTEADGGAFLTDFTQIGRSTVTGFGGAPAILDITALGQGDILFDSRAASNGLFGPNAWLVLTLGDPAGSGALGRTGGNVFVRWLDVEFHGTGGSADLGGTIGNLGGQVAAGSAGISPHADSNYRFNSCPIHSVHCVLLSVEGLPPRNPLEDFSLGALNDGGGDDELLLPIVSDRDY